MFDEKMKPSHRLHDQDVCWPKLFVFDSFLRGPFWESTEETTLGRENRILCFLCVKSEEGHGLFFFFPPEEKLHIKWVEKTLCLPDFSKISEEERHGLPSQGMYD